MSRPVRIEFPGAVYHVTSRSKDRETVFKDKEDRGAFLNVVENVVDRFGWLIHSYVIMNDHYHLVVEVPDANLSKGMRQLNGVYTQHFNRRHGQDGPIFQGRFKGVLLEKKNFLLPVCRHVVTNPNRCSEELGEKKNNFAKYKWSSYKALSGQVKTPSFLHTADVLAFFGKRDKDAQRKYRDYVKEGVNAESPLEQRTSQVLLGSPKFVGEMQPILQGERLSKRGPKAVRRRRTLPAIFKRVEQKSRIERNELIRKAHLEYGYTLMEIGEHLGLHYTTVSKVVNA